MNFHLFLVNPLNFTLMDLSVHLNSKQMGIVLATLGCFQPPVLINPHMLPPLCISPQPHLANPASSRSWLASPSFDWSSVQSLC